MGKNVGAKKRASKNSADKLKKLRKLIGKENWESLIKMKFGETIEPEM